MADAIVIQMTLDGGRTVDVKRDFYKAVARGYKAVARGYKAVARGLHERVGLRQEDVLINLVEVGREDWFYGNGEAQYVE